MHRGIVIFLRGGCTFSDVLAKTEDKLIKEILMEVVNFPLKLLVQMHYCRNLHLIPISLFNNLLLPFRIMEVKLLESRA